MSDIIYPTKVRVASTYLDDWCGLQRKWLEANQGRVVEGRMVDDDEFRPVSDNPPTLVLYDSEYEVVEGLTLEELREQVQVRIVPDENNRVIYTRRTKKGSDVVNPSEAFYLMLLGCTAQFAITDPKCPEANYEGEFNLERI